MYTIWYHYIMVTLFPLSGNAYINFNKSVYNRSTGKYFDMTTTRKVTFDYAINYLVKHEMKMEKGKGSDGIFESVKKWTEWE